MIKLKRAYDRVSPTDGSRLLVERLWPRGLLKDKLKLDGWLRAVAPTTELRKWFGHDPAKWRQFRIRYFRELDSRPESWRSNLAPIASSRQNCLLPLRSRLRRPRCCRRHHVRRTGSVR